MATRANSRRRDVARVVIGLTSRMMIEGPFIPTGGGRRLRPLLEEEKGREGPRKRRDQVMRGKRGRPEGWRK